MRIAFIINKFPVLSQTFILNQITGLIDGGHEVDIYASRPNNHPKIHPDVEKYNLLTRTHYWYVPRNFYARILKAVGLLLINCYKSPLILLRSLNFLKYGKQATSLRLFYAAVCFLGSSQYDIIHCHYGTNGITGMCLREINLLKGKIITTFHGYDVSSYLKKFGRHVYDRLFDKSDLLLPISEYMRCQLIRLGCDEKKIISHRMGVDGRRFYFRPYQLHSDGVVRLATIARLVEKKGIEYGIRAVAKLVKLNKKIEYNIVGDGYLRKKLYQFVQELDIMQTVKFLGWKQQEEVAEILDNADILLAPSVTGKDGNKEGIPVVLIEAMAKGLPVISTQHSGIPELVKDGQSGFLVPEKDVDALADRIEFLITHPDVCSEMGKCGRKIFEEKYDIRNLNQQLFDIYQNLIEGKCGTG